MIRKTKFKKGVIQSKGKISNGKKHGKWIYYGVKNDSYIEVTYKDGIEHGKQIEYEEGKLIKIVTFKNGLQNGREILYHDNEVIKVKGSYKDGKEHGKFQFFNDDGTLEEEGMYKNGKREGDWIFNYYINEHTQHVHTYKNDELFSVDGVVEFLPHSPKEKF